MDKKCKRCNQVKLLSEFPLNSPDKKGRRYYMSKCKKCMVESVRPYVKKYMKENPERSKQYNKNTRFKRNKILEELKQEGCVKCGDKRHYVIDFHHLDPSKKDIAMSDGSIKQIMKEKDKCILLCSNCHREFHYLEKTQGININSYAGTN
jgi:hypothetical protein